MRKKRIFKVIVILIISFLILVWIVEAYFIDYAETRYYCEYRLPDGVKIIRREDYKKDKSREQYFIEVNGKLYMLITDSNAESNLLYIKDGTATPLHSCPIKHEKVKVLFNELPIEVKTSKGLKSLQKGKSGYQFKQNKYRQPY
jgi:hypothetical protein